jgi:hypothetical protein
VLLDARVPAVALLRLEIGIAERAAGREGREEQLVERRRAEALSQLALKRVSVAFTR